MFCVGGAWMRSCYVMGEGGGDGRGGEEGTGDGCGCGGGGKCRNWKLLIAEKVQQVVVFAVFENIVCV